MHITQGKEAVPETVDHVLVLVDPREDRSWLQSEPTVPTDNAHIYDTTGPNIDTSENWSEAVKKLKPRVLQRLIDTHRCPPPNRAPFLLHSLPLSSAVKKAADNPASTLAGDAHPQVSVSCSRAFLWRLAHPQGLRSAHALPCSHNSP
jgi:hypothetical protein